MTNIINIYQKSKIVTQKKYDQELNNLKEKHIKEMIILENDIKAKQSQIVNLEINKNDLELKLKKLEIKCEKLKNRIMIIQENYGKDRIKLVRLEDNYRNIREIQKIILEDMDDNIPGLKKLQMKSKIRFRELSKLFLADPLLHDLSDVSVPGNPADPQTIIELDKLDLENKVKMFEIQGKIEETAEELVDVGLDTKDFVSYHNAYSLTEFQDFPISLVDFYHENHLPADLNVLEKLLNEKLNDENFDIKEFESYFGFKIIEEPPTLGVEFFDFPDNAFDNIKDDNEKSQIKVLLRKYIATFVYSNEKKLEKIKKEFAELSEKLKNEREEVLLLRKKVFLGYKENIKLKAEVEGLTNKSLPALESVKRKDGFKRLRKSNKKRSTVIQEFKLNTKVSLYNKDTISPAEDIFHKMQINKEKKTKVSIRSITLIKLINVIIADYSMQMKEDEIPQTQPLYIYIYEHFVAKHGGIRKILESKYRQFLGACEYHKAIPQIGLFCRFLGLFDPFEIEYFRLYLVILDLLQLHSRQGIEIILSEVEDTLIPSIRCFEVIDSYFKGKHQENEIKNIKLELLKITKPCPKNINQGVLEKTDFILFMINQYKKYLEISNTNVKDLFDAADLNGDKFLQFVEFDMLLRCVEYDRYNPSLSRNIFDSYSDLIAEMNGNNYPAISYDRFTIFALEKDFFKKNAQLKFFGTDDPVEISKRLQVLHNKNFKVISELK